MTKVHFVGSVGLDSPEEVFATIGTALGPHLVRVPDGEPGGRRLWISWQIPVLRANPSLSPVGENQILLKLADGVNPTDVHFGELGYAREARASYQDFLTARQMGQLPETVRFQVSLPTPWAVVMPFRVQPDAAQIYPAYEDAMLKEVDRMCGSIPHEDLAIQWDVCIEMVAWDGRWINSPPFDRMDEVFSRIFERLGAVVPADVELGFHLCYGDLDARHFLEPTDASKMAELTNLIRRSAKRNITWMHLPVPIDRTDDAFFVPLQDLDLAAETELYLGVVHAQDGVEGTRRRMDVAKKQVADFGIASECGISRGRDANMARRFIETYAGAAAD